MNASFPYVLVTDRTIYPEPLIPYLKKRIPDLSPFPSALILREKDLSKEAYEDLFKETAHLCKAWKLPLLAHNHPDLALDDAIAGVHMPLRSWTAWSKISRSRMPIGKGQNEAALSPRRGNFHTLSK